MSNATNLRAALERVSRALDSLDSAVEVSLEKNRSHLTLEEEVQRLGEDRSRLVQDLDASEAHGNNLAEVNRDVSKRLVTAMEAIRTLLSRHDR
jgi:hypothetical protein